ncbi:metal-binding protein [bacterium SCSIO 12643]|nr:metal-binding protein [bacterium SCSIO 12643]
MIFHNDIHKIEMLGKIKSREIQFAGNQKLKIYGLLNCASGKRMLRVNRVFFSSERDALQNGYRPCGHCLRVKYKEWKINKI